MFVAGFALKIALAMVLLRSEIRSTNGLDAMVWPQTAATAADFAGKHVFCSLAHGLANPAVRVYPWALYADSLRE